MTRKRKARIQFIESIKAKIVANVPVAFGDEEAVRESIARWEASEKPTRPLDHGVFAMCEKIATEINRGRPTA